MDLYVGLAAFRGRIERYGFELLELPVSASLPKQKTLRGYAEAKPKLRFSLRLPPEVIEGAAGSETLLARAIAASDALKASFIVVSSGPRFRPTTANRARLEAVCAQLVAEGRQVAWEPRGMWSADEVRRWAEDAGALVVRDLTRESAPEGDVVYTRLLPFGVGTRVTQNAVEKLAEALEGKSEAYVVIAGEGAQGARARLRQWLELGASEADDGLGDEDDEADDGLGDEYDEADDES